MDRIHYTLDVAYSSDAEPVRPDRPIAMSYGFSHGEAGYDNVVGDKGWSQDGQMKETMDLNQTFWFKIIDTAKTPATLKKIEITFDEKGSPFSWSKLSIPGDLPLPSPAGSEMSYGCNVRGTSWSPHATWKAINAGDFECTVTVWVQTADGRTKIFCVDPEMIIKGG